MTKFPFGNPCPYYISVCESYAGGDFSKKPTTTFEVLENATLDVIATFANVHEAYKFIAKKEENNG